MSPQDRNQETRNFLYKILARKGTIYTLGLCMGILMRLSRQDYTLYKELKKRAEDS